MSKYLSKILKLDRPYLYPAILLYISSFLLGAFLAVYEIFSHTTFLNTQQPVILLYVYLQAGLIGILLFFQYSYFVRKIPLKPFILLQFAIVLLILGTAWYLEFMLKITWSPDLGLTLFFPLAILLIAAIRRFTRGIFISAVNGKIIKGVEKSISLGLLTVGALFFSNLLNKLSILNSSYIAAGTYLMAFALIILLSLHHSGNLYLNHRREAFVPVRSTFLLFRSKYTRHLYLFGVLSGLIGTLIHYGFMNLIAGQFSYISTVFRFFGSMVLLLVVASYLLDTFVRRKILYSYDSPYVIISIPILVIIGSLLILLVSITIGESTVEGYSILFLLFIILKLGLDFCRSTMQTPSLRTLFRTLDIRYRQIIYSRAEGITTMTGIFTGGAILILLYQFTTWNSTLNLVMIILFSALWFFVTYKLISHFKHIIADTINTRKFSTTEAKRNNLLEERMQGVLANTDASMVINALKLSSQFQPLTYERDLIRMIPHPTMEIKKYIIDQIALEPLLPYLIDLKNLLRTASDEEYKLIKPVVDDFERKVAEIDQDQGLDAKITSNRLGDKIMAIEYIWAINDERYYPALVSLSKEFEPEVKMAAIKTMARIAHPDFSYLLIECLSSEEYFTYAFDALVSIGEPCVEDLEKLFNMPQTPEIILSRIVRIYGKIGSAKTVELLIGKLENQNQVVVKQVIQALKESHFQATNKNTHKLLNVIVRTIAPLGLNLQIYEQIKIKRNYRVLTDAFRDEIKENYQQLFDLLSLTYNRPIISQVERHIKSNNEADLSYAMELLELLVDEEIKPILFPLFENIPNAERIKHLQYYFPIEQSTVHDMLLEIITRDFNQLSIYPRVCALFYFENMKDNTIPPELIFSLYHPNIMMKETAAYVIEQNKPGYIQTLKNRLDPEIFNTLLKSLANIQDQQQSLIVDKYRMVKKTNIFAGLPENILIALAQSMKIIKLVKGDVIRLTIRQRELNLFFLLKGCIVAEDGTEIKQIHEISSVYYSKVLISSGINYFEVTQDTEICAIDQNTTEKLLFDNEQLAGSLLSCIENNRL